MQVARTLADLASVLAALPRPLGLVPTMGALHAGHASLLAAARRECASVVASIFINPSQFGPGEDLAAYPRDEPGDLALLERGGCDVAWLPDAPAMYPPGHASWIDPGSAALRWEGEWRPGHFRGVATVCAKLFGQTGAGAAYFGEKDWQQLTVIRRVVLDLHLPIRIIGVPTVRDADGLALSSRNRRLTPEQRRVAASLPAILARCARSGADEAARLAAMAELDAAGFGVDYLAAVDGLTLEPLRGGGQCGRLIAAVRLGAVRLLDNWRITGDGSCCSA